MTHRYAFTSKDAPTPGGAYSQAIGTDEIVWTAGLGPQHPVTGEIVGSDITEQTHQVLRNLRAVLAAAGCQFKDVVKSTVHLSDLHRDFREFDAVYREYFPAPYPARTTVGSDLYGILVEIDVVAVRPA